MSKVTKKDFIEMQVRNLNSQIEDLRKDIESCIKSIQDTAFTLTVDSSYNAEFLPTYANRIKENREKITELNGRIKMLNFMESLED